jgi:SAM-dependent methyltransferase
MVITKKSISSITSTLTFMTKPKNIETIACPYCHSSNYKVWADEIGFTAVRCADCTLIFCNPRPSLKTIDSAVTNGAHGDDAHNLNVVSRRSDAKVKYYSRVFAKLFDDVWRKNEPVSWLDIGAGYGEVLEAVNLLAPEGSEITGLEPMEPKAVKARERGLNVINDYLRPGHPKADIVSLVDVFSHIPDFRQFLMDVSVVLKTGGELFIETGNLADIELRKDFPGPLGLPDHLVFAGEQHLIGYLDKAGFDIVRIERKRVDGFVNLAKNIVKKLIGRSAGFGLPYTSKYRQLQIRAKLRQVTV